MQRQSTLSALLPIACMSCLWACASGPPQDPAGGPGRALSYTLGQRAGGSFDCEDGDCQDWYLFETSQPGSVNVSVEAQRADGTSAEVELTITGAQADVLATAQSRSGQLQERWVIRPTPHYFRITTAGAEGGEALSYTLRTDFEPDYTARRKAAPKVESTPKPRAGRRPVPTVERVPTPEPDPSWRIVEALLIGIDGDEALLGEGSLGGIRVGFRGRIVEGGRAVARFEVIQVFPEGSRARLDNVPDHQLTPGAKALVEVPLDQ